MILETRYSIHDHHDENWEKEIKACAYEESSQEAIDCMVAVHCCAIQVIPKYCQNDNDDLKWEFIFDV